jgi:RNA polymerase sigma-70 factor, ECF subfamily
MTANAGATTARLVETARDPARRVAEQHAAFAHLVEENQHIVFGLALASLRDVEDARDVAQDTFTTAWHRLPQLRDPSVFTAWLKAIVATQCSRLRRKRRLTPENVGQRDSIESDAHRLDYQAVIASALDRLPEGERSVTVLYYFLGHTLPQIARLLGLNPGTVGKRLHSARLRMRRELPRSVRGDFVRLVPSEAFLDRVSRGLLDEYVGDYRFERRPDHVVSITRQGDSLVSISAGQRHLLVSADADSLVAGRYDGEGRFGRNRRGEVTHFVYYEFGRRLGIARRVRAS